MVKVSDTRLNVFKTTNYDGVSPTEAAFLREHYGIYTMQSTFLLICTLFIPIMYENIQGIKVDLAKPEVCFLLLLFLWAKIIVYRK